MFILYPIQLRWMTTTRFLTLSLPRSPAFEDIPVPALMLVLARYLEKREEVFTRQCRDLLPASASQVLILSTKSGVGLSFLTTVQCFIHPLQRPMVYPIGDMNWHSVLCLFLHMDMLLMQVHLILLIMDYPVYEKAPKTC